MLFAHQIAFQNIRVALHEVESVISELLKAIEPLLLGKDLITCPTCLQKTAIVEYDQDGENGKLVCFLCKDQFTADDAANNYLQNVLGYFSEDCLFECGHCGSYSLIALSDDLWGLDFQTLCFNCANGSTRYIEICAKCGAFFDERASGYGTVCSKCFHKTINSSHT